MLWLKRDLSHKRQVSEEEAHGFAEQHGLLFAEISALDTYGIEDAFERLMNGIKNILVVVESH